MPMHTTRTVARIVISCAAVSAFAAPSFAGGRPEGRTQKWFGHVSGGYGFAEGDTSDNLDDSWMISGGATYWPADWPVGLSLELGYADFDLSDASIDKINQAIALDPNNGGRIDDGDVSIWKGTINAIWGPGSHDNGVYLTGGIGAYHLEGTITQTGLVYYPPFCDPWYWWWCFPGGVGTGAIVKGKDSTTEFGWNLGVGYSFPAGDGQLFLEAKYTSINTDGSDVTFLPLSIGFRW
ncbi:MAG TPA: outer membrane beta-barrel protein [Gammaproteobacteria bacterium]|nr:outer membrane beta-barrel protein [Gammaproteobacteria bacterium]